MKTNMQQTSELGTQFWNDSCSTKELSEAVSQGAVGATSNPVIVYEVVKKEEQKWIPVLDDLISNNKCDTEAELAWKLIVIMAGEAAKTLYPVYEKTRKQKGRLSIQVNPELYVSTERMIEQALILSSIAPNIAIKIPCTAQGVAAIEELTARGIVVNVTVSFSVSQAIKSAEAIEAGLKRARANGIDTSIIKPFVTMMVGRLDDQLKRVMNTEKISVDPGCLEWAGVACMKKSYKIFKERYYSSTLLSAAYRNHMHWSEFIGGDVIVSIPYAWWNQFNNSDIEVKSRIDNEVNPDAINILYSKFSDFRKCYDEDGMQPEEFVQFGASKHTINQFISGYYQLIEYVRQRRL